MKYSISGISKEMTMNRYSLYYKADSIDIKTCLLNFFISALLNSKQKVQIRGEDVA
jgi:hypothetical protein